MPPRDYVVKAATSAGQSVPFMQQGRLVLGRTAGYGWKLTCSGEAAPRVLLPEAGKDLGTPGSRCAHQLVTEPASLVMLLVASFAPPRSCMHRQQLHQTGTLGSTAGK